MLRQIQRSLKSRIELAENLPVSANSGLEFTPYITSDNDDMRAYPKNQGRETFILLFFL